jgi:hypothetical protein
LYHFIADRRNGKKDSVMESNKRRMDMKKISMLMAVLAVVVLSGCATAIPSGRIYSEMTLPMLATGNTKGTKVGVSTCTSILGVVATGDASVQAAMDNGKIKKVSHIDWKVMSEIPLGIKTVYTTTVYGD